MWNTEPKSLAGSRVATISTSRDGTGVAGPTTSDSEPAVRLLGPVQVTVDGVPVSLSSPKLRRLFSVLALSQNRVVSSDRLIDQLWGVNPPDSANATLHVYISRLRRVLNPSSALQIGRRAPGYVLSVPEEAVDVCRFTRLVDAARQQVAGDAAHALALLDEALALVAGEPLADVTEELDPLAADARRLRELVLAAQEQQVEALLGCGRPQAAVSSAEALLVVHPLRETALALRVLALYRSGRSADALAAYEEFRRRLDDELGADPGPQLRRLHARILQQDPELMGPPRTPSGPPPNATGGSAGGSAGGSTGLAYVGSPRSPLVGRGPTMAQLTQAVARLADGQGGCGPCPGRRGSARRGWSRSSPKWRWPPRWPWSGAAGRRGRVTPPTGRGSR